MRLNILIAGAMPFILAQSIATADNDSGSDGSDTTGSSYRVTEYQRVEGPGILLSESSVLHPSFGAEVGLDSNLFREEQSAVFSPLFRLSAALDVASLPLERLRPGQGGAANRKLEYRAGVSARYTEFLTGNNNAQQQRNVALTADADLKFFPKEFFTFRLQDDFDRLIRPRNFESDGQIPRDINNFRASAGLQPGGRSIYMGVYYQNLLDYFESVNSRFANRINHDIGAQITWKWRPFTEFWADASYGFYGGFQTQAENYKVSSNPLRLRLGARSAITERLTLSLFAGFAQGNYERDASFTGAIVGAQAGFRYSPAGRVTLSYNHDYRDSINANYFGEHVFRLQVAQNLDRISLNAFAEARLRGYRGISASLGPQSNERDDDIFNAGIGAQYWLSERLVLTADYFFIYNDTDFRNVLNGASDDPSYQRNALFVGARLAY